MFNDPGKKIETLAQIFFIVDIALSVVGWLVLLILGITENIATYVVLSMLVLVFGIIGSWIINLLLLAFGRLVKNSDIIVNSIDTEEVIADNVPFGSKF